MKPFQAKEVVPGEFWVIRNDRSKVGEIEYSNMGYTVSLGQKKLQFDNQNDLFKSQLFEFTHIKLPSDEPTYDVFGYPTDSLAYNGMWNTELNVPMFTKQADNTAWVAAGYYQIGEIGYSDIVFCPKLFVLQRESYAGPFKTEPSRLVSVFDIVE